MNRLLFWIAIAILGGAAFCHVTGKCPAQLLLRHVFAADDKKADQDSQADDQKMEAAVTLNKLTPEEERVIEFGYRVIWPGARAITYR